jgi:hypothetical protein
MSTTLASSIPVYSAAQRCQRGGSPLSWLKWVYIAALVVRLALVAFGQWQDANCESDAAPALARSSCVACIVL